MAFTTVSKAGGNLRNGDWQESAFFYREDIAILLNQPEAVSLRVVNSRFPDKGDTLALIAVKQTIDGNGGPQYVDLDGPDHLVALGCNPYNVRGGNFDPNP